MLYGAGTGLGGYIGYKVSVWVKQRLNFSDDGTPKQELKRDDNSLSSYNFTQDSTGNWIFDYDSTKMKIMEMEGEEAKIRHSKLVFNSEGNFVNGTHSLYLDRSDSISKREEGYIQFSYGAKSGHEKTNLSRYQIESLVSHMYSDALNYDNGITGFCGEMNNGGDWEGWIAIAVNEEWGDCTWWIQNHI